MLKNPLSTQNDVAALAAELECETPDEKTVSTLRNKIVLKSAAKGLMLGAAIIGAAAVIVKSCNQQDDETTSDE